MIGKISIAALVMALAVTPLAGAYDDGHAQHSGPRHHHPSVDHKVARKALARGEVLPLEKILVLVRPELKGEVVGLRFETHDGIWMYEFRVVDAAGHLQYIHADAKTGKLIPVESQ